MSQFKEELDYEQELINRAINRDEDAFELIWNIYSRRVLTLAERILRDIRDAQDVVSEVCFKVWKALPNFRNESSFYTWVRRITINHAKSFLQKKLRYKKFLESNDLGAYWHQSIEKTTPRTVLCLLELRDLIAQAILNLSEKMQDVIVLRAHIGMSYKRIATTVGCKIGTVMSRLNAARIRIKVFLEMQGFDPQL